MLHRLETAGERHQAAARVRLTAFYEKVCTILYYTILYYAILKYYYFTCKPNISLSPPPSPQVLLY